VTSHTDIIEDDSDDLYQDPLTGLYNQAFFRTILEREIMRTHRYGTSVAVGLIEIDGFSQSADHPGSEERDRVVKEVANIIRENMRRVDLAARIDDGLMAILLIQSDSTSARKATAHIGRLVDTLTESAVTVTIGFAACPQDAPTAEALVQKARDALKQAKNLGKNRVFGFESPSPSVGTDRHKILLVDDDQMNVSLMESRLKAADYDVLKAYNGEDALAVVRDTNVDLILLDIIMPGMDGYEVCQNLKESEATRLIPIVMLTALDDTESRVKGIEAGADDFISKPPNRAELMARIRSLLRINTLNRDLTCFENVLISLAYAVEAKDVYTQGHIMRVSDFAVLIGKQTGVSESDLKALRLGGILHDIGKIGISEDILNKPGALTDDEWAIMKQHPAEGHRICTPLKMNLGPALLVIRHHHEKLDGSGYPDALKGEEISRLARIMAIADIYDALTSDRAYRKGMDKDRALGILKEEAADGKLDEAIVNHLIDMVQ